MPLLAHCPLRMPLMLTAITLPETELVLMRFGLGGGSVVVITAKPPGGPVVLEHEGCELALGREYMVSIEATVVT